jgi:hypothetical protein
MSQYQDSGWRQVDGYYAQHFWVPVPFTAMREVVSNDIPAMAGTPPAGVLAKDSTPNLEFTNGDTDSALRLEWAASNNDPVAFQVPLPPHLDPSTALTVNLYAAIGGTTDSLVIASDAYFDKGDTKVEDNSGTVTGATPANYTITIAAADIPIGARTMTVELTPGNHTTDELELYSVWVEGKYIP